MPQIDRSSIRFRREGTTRYGKDYWGLSLGAKYKRPFLVWSNEVPELIDDLQLLGNLDLGRSLPRAEEGNAFYPLNVHIRTGGGILLGVFVRPEGSQQVSFRRLTTSFKPDKQEKVFTGRFNYHGRPMFEARTDITAPLLAEFAWVADELRRIVFERLAKLMQEDLPEVQSVANSIARITLQGVLEGQTRMVPFDFGYPEVDTMNIKLLDAPVLQRVLAHTSGAKNLQDIAARVGHVLDAEALGLCLNWCTRYDPHALEGGFFVNPDSGDTRVRALQERSLFASDPSLSALIGAEPLADKCSDSRVPSPQYHERAAAIYDAALKRGWVAEHRKTRLGICPIPMEERCVQMQNLAKPDAGLAKCRWLLLQMLHLHAACLANRRFLQGSVAEPNEDLVLLIQRTALLYYDVSHFFRADLEMRPDIQGVLADALVAWTSSWLEGANSLALIQPSKFPRSTLSP